MHKVEITRTRGGYSESEDAEFETLEAARQWADVMSAHYGYKKIWINGVPYAKQKDAN